MEDVSGGRRFGGAGEAIEGALGKQLLSSGLTQDQLVAVLRSQGQNQQADLLSGLQLNPAGIDFGALGGVLSFLVGVYILSSIFSWMQGWIMAGVTQCIMLSLSMVVIAALVGADGLGKPVVRALNTVNIGMGFEAGAAIVLLAIVLDRVCKRPEHKSGKR